MPYFDNINYTENTYLWQCMTFGIRASRHFYVRNELLFTGSIGRSAHQQITTKFDMCVCDWACAALVRELWPMHPYVRTNTSLHRRTHNKTQIRCCAIKLMIWRCLSNKTIVVHLAVVDDINLYRFRYIYMYRSIDTSNTNIHCVATLNGKKFLLNHPAHQFLHSHRPF